MTERGMQGERKSPVPSAMRVVSLLPSATEIVCALGGGGRLVGRSHECDYPAEIASVPVCTRSRVDSSKSSVAIDLEVKNLLANAVSLYEVDLARIRELKPDLILTQAQCEVCAVSLAQVEAAVAGWADSRPQLLSLSPQRFAQVWNDMHAVAKALGMEEQGRDVVRQLKYRVADVIERTAGLKGRPTVACIEWLEPLMAAGNWVPELVELAGGQNLLGQAGQHSPWLKWEELQRADPDIIVAMPCGFGLDRVRQEFDVLAKHPAWKELRAVRHGRTYLADGNHYFNRPGPRLVDSLEILAEVFHSDLFRFGREGKAWSRV